MHLEEKCYTVCAKFKGIFGDTNGQNAQALLSLCVQLVLDKTKI